VAEAFDLAGINNTAGAPSFAFFAKSGSRDCLRDWVAHDGAAVTNQIPQAASLPTRLLQGWVSRTPRV
jgi:hypothetical protein